MVLLVSRGGCWYGVMRMGGNKSVVLHRFGVVILLSVISYLLEDVCRLKVLDGFFTGVCSPC